MISSSLLNDALSQLKLLGYVKMFRFPGAAYDHVTSAFIPLSDLTSSIHRQCFSFNSFWGSDTKYYMRYSPALYWFCSCNILEARPYLVCHVTRIRLHRTTRAQSGVRSHHIRVLIPLTGLFELITRCHVLCTAKVVRCGLRTRPQFTIPQIPEVERVPPSWESSARGKHGTSDSSYSYRTRGRGGWRGEKPSLSSPAAHPPSLFWLAPVPRALLSRAESCGHWEAGWAVWRRLRLWCYLQFQALSRVSQIDSTTTSCQTEDQLSVSTRRHASYRYLFYIDHASQKHASQFEAWCGSLLTASPIEKCAKQKDDYYHTSLFKPHFFMLVRTKKFAGFS